MQTQEQIDATAARLRELGVPDMLNRWLRMTPASLAANERARAKIARETYRREPVRKINGNARSTISVGHAANLDDAGKALLKEITKEQQAKKLARLQSLKELKAVKTTGSKESKLRAQREAEAKDETAAKAEAPNANTKESDVRKTKTAKAKKAASAKAKTTAPKPAKKTNGDGPRPGSKLEIIQGLLTRAEGCTTKQVLDACKWPAVSMPQQARALGIKLKKEKVEGVTVYRAA